MSADVELQRIRPLAERVVASHGLELFDVHLRRESIGWVLRVTIDLPTVVNADGQVQVESTEQGIGIEQCEAVSRDLGTLLDVEDVVTREHTLEVSSPGIDRPLRGATDYQRFAGRVAKIVVAEPVDGQSHFEGRLVGLEGDQVVLVSGKKEKRLPLASISRARLAVEF